MKRIVDPMQSRTFGRVTASILDGRWQIKMQAWTQDWRGPERLGDTIQLYEKLAEKRPQQKSYHDAVSALMWIKGEMND